MITRNQPMLNALMKQKSKAKCNSFLANAEIDVPEKILGAMKHGEQVLVMFIYYYGDNGMAQAIKKVSREFGVREARLWSIITKFERDCGVKRNE